jgi:hypothetical protein
MAFFIQVRNTLGAMPFVRFYMIWIAITAGAVIYVVWVVGRATTPGGQQVRNAPIADAWTQRSIGRSRLAALALLALFLVFYTVLMLAWEDFAYYDDAMFTSGTLMGHDVIPIIGGGRFIPLAGQEFNLVRHFTDIAKGYHVLPIVQVLIFSCILLILDSELDITARAALAMLALLTPSILISFSTLSVSSERNVLFFLACLALFVKRFEQTGSITWATAATVCAQTIIYFKETAFLLIFGLASGRLILRCKSGHMRNWDFDRLRVNESRLDLCLAGLAMLFFLFYLVMYSINGNMSYAVEHRQPLTEIVLAYLRLDLLSWLLLPILLCRIYLILRHQVAPSLLWDGLAFGGAACFLGYVVGLRMFSAIYLAPVDLIAVLYVGRFAVLSWKRIGPRRRTAAAMLALIVLLQDVWFSAFAVFERKNDIHAKVEIASVLETRYRSGVGNLHRLFFPFASPFAIMGFGSYLNYQGVPVEGASDQAAGPNRVVLATRALKKDGPCFGGGGIVCRAVTGPAQGDLVIVLPDDEASLTDANVYRHRGELLLLYEPYPRLPDWVYSLARNLVGEITIAAFRYTHNPLSNRWMDASVTVWD